MDVEQTLKVLEFGRDLSMKAAGIWRGCSAATTAEYLNQADACSHAIAIIKAAQEFKQAREDALEPQTITLKVDEMEGREDDH